MNQSGRPIILFDVDDIKENVKGANSLRSSMGPKGMDKMLISQDGD